MQFKSVLYAVKTFRSHEKDIFLRPMFCKYDFVNLDP